MHPDRPPLIMEGDAHCPKRGGRTRAVLAMQFEFRCWGCMSVPLCKYSMTCMQFVYYDVAACYTVSLHYRTHP